MKSKRWASVVFSALPIVLPAAGQQHSAIPADPVNPHASPEVRALLKYFYSISGHYTLSGQHNYPSHLSRWTDRVYDLTGKYPTPWFLISPDDAGSPERSRTLQLLYNDPRVLERTESEAHAAK